MNYWIVKSPFKHHPWSEILFSGKFHLFGIRNFQSRNNIRDMKARDKALFYSSSNGRKIFGILEVAKEPYQDPSTSDGRWLACDFKPVFTFPKPLLTNELKKFPGFKDSPFSNLFLFVG